MPWVAGAIFTDPPAGTVLADTGPLPARWHYVTATVRARPPGLEVAFRRVAADGVTVIQSQVLPVLLEDKHFDPDIILATEAGERYVVAMLTDGYAGEVQASVFFDRR